MNAGRAWRASPPAKNAAIRRVFLLLWVVLCVSARGRAQLVRVEGGASSLMGTQGGAVQIDTGRRSFSLGLGWSGGLRSGFSFDTPFLGGRLDLGDQLIPFAFPTDLFDPGDYFVGRGAGFRWEGRNESLFLFGGVTSQSLNSPFFDAASPQEAVGALFYRRRLAPRFWWSSFNLFSGKLTTIQSFEWRPRRGWSLALSGGAGYRQPYGAASARIHRKRFDVLASYTLTNSAFRRLRLSSPLFTETDGANLRVEYRPWRWAGAAFSHQNILAPVAGGAALRARVDGLSGWFTGGGFQIDASAFRSLGPAGPSRAFMVSAERSLTAGFQARVDYFRSKTAAAPAYAGFDAGLRQRMGNHLYISETYLTGGGQHTFSFGGGFSSNPLDIGVDYQTIFVPFALPGQPPFRQVMLLTVRCRLWSWLEFHATTNYTALGQTRYTAYATTETYSASSLNAPTRRTVRRAIAGYVIRGRVQDVERKPVFGAALLIGRRKVFTDEEGVFVLRRKKPGEYSLKIDFPAFLFPGAFQVVSAPERVRAKPDGTGSTAVIVLRRLPPKDAREGALRDR